MRLPLLLFFILLSTGGISQQLKSPSEFFGYDLGTQFTRHHEAIDYFEYIARSVPNQVRLEEYGKTNERRPLVLAFVSSAENMQNLATIREEHLKSAVGQGNGSKAIVWLGYNVHGNESVGTEAAMQTIYELLVNRSDELDNTVVIIDPCMNPDGRDRYVNWYNQHGNSPHNPDPNSVEHHEAWWNGRTNHYMFDLNRDWAWLTQIESRQRLKFYNQWLPHVHVDFHEQGVDSPYYFAPAAEPFHEVITDFQRSFQETIGKNHAKYFDANGWFYFTQEIFDLLYPSYGDTYPTYNGSIGMTYEQGGSGRAGLGIVTSIGDTLTLKDRITHHLTTGLSTIEIAAKNAPRLNEEFKKFHQNRNYRYKSYVLDGNGDKIDALTKLLDQHGIVYGWAKKGNAKGYNYTSGTIESAKISQKNLVVSTNQTKGTLVKVLFEPSTKLSDSLTYDSTAWSLPYAYGLNTLACETDIDATQTTANSNVQVSKKSNVSKNAYAFLTNWSSMKSARFLAALLQKNIRVRSSKNPIALNGHKYNRGSLIITSADNKDNPEFLQILVDEARKHNILLTATYSGFTKGSGDFGPNTVQMVKNIKVAVLSGKPTSPLHLGEIWHFFEQQLQYPLTILDAEYIDEVDFSDYDVLILPNGDGYKNFMADGTLSDMRNWVNNGGKLIAMGDALKALSGKKGFGISPKEKAQDHSIMIYEDAKREHIMSAITGAIFKTRVDDTHPLAYGYDDTYFTLKMGNEAYAYLEKGTVVYLDKKDSDPIAGFAGCEAKKEIADTLVFGVERHGQGQVIYLVDNPLFRGFWENGKLFFANALFMVHDTWGEKYAKPTPSH